MNFWAEKSIDIANKGPYLDRLFEIYPVVPNGNRSLSDDQKEAIRIAHSEKIDDNLIDTLLDLDVFPISNSYVAYFKRDHEAIHRNPTIVHFLCEFLYEMTIEEIFQNCQTPIQSSRQIGPMFKRWVDSGSLGIPVFRDAKEFLVSKKDGILSLGDAALKDFVQTNLGYNLEKGLDLLARVKGTYLFGEAKFLTDFGGAQNNQFNSAFGLSETQFPSNQKCKKAIGISILDGICYIKNTGMMYSKISQSKSNQVILSALLLGDYLKSL
jgi:hypothetical protein